MIIICKECSKEISDKASVCPHCGFPLKTVKKPKHPRLPNGFGQISKLNNPNLRKPYRAMVTVGFNEEGKPICKTLKPNGYFKTYNEAYTALLEYNSDPYDLNETLTVSELFDDWSPKYFKTLKSNSTISTTKSIWKYCEPLYDLPVRSVRTKHIRTCIENINPAIAIKVKSLLNQMFDYAVEYELTDRNYARQISNLFNKGSKSPEASHISFTDEEMNLLWKNIKVVPFTDAVIIQAYMGWRPQELGLIKLCDVDINEWSIVGGMKTDAGTDRKVPVHENIKDLVLNRYNEAIQLNSEYLFNCTEKANHKMSMFMTYQKYKTRFERVMSALNLNPAHRPHDPRKQFVTMAKKYNVDEYAIKRIVGHEIDDITERVYTDRDFEWLKKEINKIIVEIV